MATTTALLKQETARSVVYQGLAEAFGIPSSAASGGLKAMAGALAQLGSEACQSAVRLAADAFNEPEARDREVDHAALFMGPFLVLAPPYGSVYLEDKRQLMGVSTMDVQKHYRTLGLDLSPDFKDAPDHICAELAFMDVLVHQAIAAITDADGERLSACLRHQRTFLEQHLGAWAPAFAGKIDEHARTGYYRCLGAVLRTFLVEELEALPDPADLLPAQA